MKKGTYDVNEPGPTQHNTRDASYKSCVCALLVFLAICLIILAIGLSLGSHKGTDDTHFKEDIEVFDPKKESLNRDKEKILQLTTRTTPTLTFTQKYKERPHTKIVTQSDKAITTEKTTFRTRKSTATSSSSSKKSTEKSAFVTNITLTTTERNPTSLTTNSEGKHTKFDTGTAISMTTPSRSTENHNIHEIFTGSNITKIINTIFTLDSSKWTQPSNASFNTSPLTTKRGTPTEDSTNDDVTANYDDITTHAKVERNRSSHDEGTTSYKIHESSDVVEQSSEGDVTDLLEKSTTVLDAADTSYSKVIDYLSESGEDNETMEDSGTTVNYSAQSRHTPGVLLGSSSSSAATITSGPTHKSTTSTISPTPGSQRPRTPVLPVKKSLPPTNKSQPPACSTSGCKSAVSRMLHLMDHSADPCENFYEFSCGEMQADNADSHKLNYLSWQLDRVDKQSSEFLRKVKQFHESCLGYEDVDYTSRVKTVKLIYDEVAHATQKAAAGAKEEFTDIFAKLTLLQSNPLMDVEVTVDKTSKFILKLTVPKENWFSENMQTEPWSAILNSYKKCLSKLRMETHRPMLNLNKMYEKYTECKTDFSNYLDEMGVTLEAIDFFPKANTSVSSKQRHALRFYVDYNILGLVVNGFRARRQSQLGKMNSEKRTVFDMQNDYAFLNWTQFFNKLTGKNVTDDMTVEIDYYDHFSYMFDELATKNLRNLSDAFLAIYANDLFQNFVVLKHRDDREQFCLKLVNEYFHDVSSHIYLSNVANGEVLEKKKLVENIFGELKDSFKSSLVDVDWLDDTSRNSLQLKMDSLQVNFPNKNNKLLLDTYLNDKYKSVDIVVVDRENFPINLFVIKERRRRDIYSLETLKVHNDYIFSHFMHPWDKIPYWSYYTTTIEVPLGIIDNFPTTLPGYLLMGRIGLHLSETIGHHFDPIGINIGVNLTDATSLTYHNFANVSTKLDYASAAPLSYQLRHHSYINSKISDSIALRLLTETHGQLGSSKSLVWIGSTFSNRQILYITAAQELCKKHDPLEIMLALFESQTLPASLRVNNLMINSRDFEETFECKDGSNMNMPEINKVQFPFLEKEEDYDDNDANLSNK